MEKTSPTIAGKSLDALVMDDMIRDHAALSGLSADSVRAAIGSVVATSLSLKVGELSASLGAFVRADKRRSRLERRAKTPRAKRRAEMRMRGGFKAERFANAVDARAEIIAARRAEEQRQRELYEAALKQREQLARVVPDAEMEISID